MALKTSKTNFSLESSINDFQKTEESIKPQKEIAFDEIANSEITTDEARKFENKTSDKIKDFEAKIKSLKNEIKVFQSNGLTDLLKSKEAELSDLESKLKKLKKSHNFYKGNILVRLPEEKHSLYKTFVAENNIKFNQFVLLSMAYLYKQVKENKLKITDYGIETTPQF